MGPIEFDPQLQLQTFSTHCKVIFIFFSQKVFIEKSALLVMIGTELDSPAAA